MPSPSAINSQRKRVFISHKHDDAEAARSFCQFLANACENQVEVFISEDIDVGADWRNSLYLELTNADVLVLIYTDPFQNWDWCFFESGYFRGTHRSDNSPVLVLHDKRVPPPAPLNNFETIPLSRGEGDEDTQNQRQKLRRWAEKLGATNLTDTTSAELEDKIIEAICSSDAPKLFAQEICLEVKEEYLRNTNYREIPEEVRVFGGESSLYKLFSLDTKANGYTWGEIYHAMGKRSHNTAEWVSSLADLMHVIALEPTKHSSAGLPLYRSANGEPRIYRPVLRSFRRKKGVLTYKILFAELPEETTVDLEQPANWLAQALTLCHMMRWGVFRPLAERLKRLATQPAQHIDTHSIRYKKVRDEVRRIAGKLVTVYAEAKNRGYSRDRLLSCFKERQIKEIKSRFAEWDDLLHKWRELPGNSNSQEMSIAQVQALISHTLNINKWFMVMYSQRYHEIVKRLPEEL
jgi:hypothetical protein